MGRPWPKPACAHTHTHVHVSSPYVLNIVRDRLRLCAQRSPVALCVFLYRRASGLWSTGSWTDARSSWRERHRLCRSSRDKGKTFSVWERHPQFHPNPSFNTELVKSQTVIKRSWWTWRVCQEPTKWQTGPNDSFTIKWLYDGLIR